MQVRHWQNSLSLFEYALKVTKNNDLAENSYGCALLETGQTSEALLHISKAVQINPAYLNARNNMGNIYLKQGKANEAITCFNYTLRQNGDSAETHYNLAIALGRQKKYEEAVEHLAKVLQLNPTYPEAHNKMGLALMAVGKNDEAIKYLNEGLKISKDQETYANLGSAYIQVGKYELATENLTKAIELKPDNIDVLNKLAWLSAAVDNTSIHNAPKAVEFAQRGCELTGYNDPMLLDTLAIAYAAAGRFDEAKATAEKALSLAKENGRENLAVAIQNRIKLYEAEQPYRQK
jgi:tetratricopeptide (TPR) repeat protein